MAPRRFFTAGQKAQQRPARVTCRDTAVAYVVDPPAQPRQTGSVQRPLMTVTEASAYLHLPSVKAIYWHIAKNGLPVRRLGRRAIRIDQGELEQWARGQRQDERQRLVMVKGA